MENFKDGNLTSEELLDVKAGIMSGEIDDTLNKMDTGELKQLSEKIKDKELTFEELDSVKAGMPQEKVEKYINANSDLFQK